MVDIKVDTPVGTSLVNLTGSDADGQDVMNFTLLKSDDRFKYFEVDALSGDFFLCFKLQSGNQICIQINST